MDTSRLRELAEHTPQSRDRYVDFLRAASILTVVVGHWMIGVLWWQDGVIRSTSAIGITPWLWLATWFLQVMPLFFFVGGFSNLTSLDSARRRGQPTSSWLRDRAMRLLKPTAVFLGMWALAQIVLHDVDVGAGTGLRLWGDTRMLRGMLPPGATIPFGPLWFLPVYLVVITLAPSTLSLHRRFRWWIPGGLVAAALVIDLIGFAAGHPGVRYWNVLFVWLLPHQLGFFYADGTLTRVSRRALVALALAGFAGLLVLTNPPLFQALGDVGPRWFSGLRSFPKSLLGTDLEPIANTYPPTFVMVAMTCWSVGVAMLLRERVSRWVARTRPWMAVIEVNSVIMTLYLWHMTAYLMALVVLWPLGFGHQHATGARWWLERPLWVLVPGVFLAGIVAIFGRFERGGSKRGAVHEPAVRTASA
jgi:fucose 4-O-acetylase-like acetyltransferase